MSSNNNEIEVDHLLEEADGSDYGPSGYSTDSTSLASSVNEFIFENGRRYHSYFGVEKNLMPTDETEQDRMDIHHEIMNRLLRGELHKSPLKKPQRILDVGTGTGIWAIDMADRYPMAVVTGIDLSPIQPGWVPPNCNFVVDDAELDWTLDRSSFDFVHFRNLDQGISKWPKVLSEAYKVLKPGGYVELSEIGVTFRCDDNSMGPNNPAYRWSVHLMEAMVKSGRPALEGGQLEKRLKDAGYEDVQVHTLKLPFGPWAKEKRLKELGIMALMAAETGFGAYAMAAFTRVLGLSNAEAEKLCREGLAATKNKNYHMYACHYIAYGRKPGKQEKEEK